VALLVESVRRRILVGILHGLLDGKSGDETLRSLPELDGERRRVIVATGRPIDALGVARR